MRVHLVWEPAGLDVELESWLADHLDEAARTVEDLYAHVWPDSAAWQTIELSLQFLDEAAMAELNAQYRGEERSTDVLSFPLWEVAGQLVTPPGGDLLPMGDLVFCAPVLREGARAAGSTPQSELALLLIHGALHLLAWDHDTEERQAAMWAAQEEFRDRLMKRAGSPKGKDEP